MQLKSSARPSRFGAMMALRCPRCLRGKVFRGLFTMNETCPNCGLRFFREPGYFIGAMYISYTFSVFLLSGIIGVLWWVFLRDWSLLTIIGIGGVLLLPFVPLMFRYSRILWMHFDWVIDPGD